MQLPLFCKKVSPLLLPSAVYLLSFPPFNLFPLMWLFPPLLTKSIDGVVSWKERFLRGLLTGILINLGLFWWLGIAIRIGEGNAGTVLAALLFLAVYQGLFFALFSVFSYFFISPFLLAALFTLIESARIYLGGFPLGIVAASQASFLPLAQAAAFSGVAGITFMIFFVSLSIFERRERRIAIPLFSAALIYGLIQLRTDNTSGREISVALLQGGIRQEMKWNREYEEKILNTYEELMSIAGKNSPDLIVWPEAALPGILSARYRLYLRKTMLYSPASSLLVGSVLYRDGKMYNTAVFFSPGENKEQVYYKLNLVPFGEYVPLRDILSPFFPVLNELGDISPGKDPVTFSVKGVRIVNQICFESLLPSHAKKIGKPGLLVNITNDAWFDDSPGSMIHFQHARFRAIENGCPLIFCNNAGLSAVVDARGRIIARSSSFFEKEAVFAKIRIQS